VTSNWFFLSTLNYDARSTTHQPYMNVLYLFIHYPFRLKMHYYRGRNLKGSPKEYSAPTSTPCLIEWC